MVREASRPVREGKYVNSRVYKEIGAVAAALRSGAVTSRPEGQAGESKAFLIIGRKRNSGVRQCGFDS
jgi:hypothetical protein